MAARPDLWLVRHGETEWSAAGRHTSRTDVPLTAAGRRQAAWLFRPLDRLRFALVLSSPRARARETARLAGFADAIVDDDLVEWDYGAYEGLTTAEIHALAPGWTVFTHPCPGGERAEQVGARARRVLARVEQSDDPVLLFAHGHLLRVFTAVALGLTPEAGARFALDPATVGVLGSEHGLRALRRWNATA